jgi:hypothetical protein
VTQLSGGLCYNILKYKTKKEGDTIIMKFDLNEMKYVYYDETWSKFFHL